MKRPITQAFFLLLLLAACQDDAANLAVAPSNQTGQGGSLARFAIAGDALYIVDDQNLKVVDISTEADPKMVGTQHVGFGIETIFPYSGKLFIGGQRGMFIYDISADQFQPQFLSEYQHIEACDPVVAQGDYAYVTLRTGTVCMQAVNELQVLNISDPVNPQLLITYPMQNPHGLGIDGNLLFICDGDAGLKVYDATNPMTISQNMLAHFPDLHAYDVIPLNGLLVIVGDDGIYQYIYRNIDKSIEQISKIPVVDDASS